MDLHQRFRPELIFPEEIWEQVLWHASSPEHLTRMQKTCILFQRILRKRSPSYLFGELLQLIHLCMNEASNYNCRLVCMSWKCAVDKSLGELLNPPPLRNTDSSYLFTSSTLRLHCQLESQHSPVILPFLTKLRYSYCFHNSSQDYLDVDNFLQHNMQSHNLDTHNPFIGNDLSLIVYPLTVDEIYQDRLANNQPPHAIDRYRIFLDKMEQMLARYGNHISSIAVTISTAHHHYDVVNNYNISAFILSLTQNLLPNLKTLRINGLVCPTNFNPMNFTSLHTFENHLNSLQNPQNLPQLDVQRIRRFFDSIDVCGVKRLSYTWNIWHDWDLKSMNWTTLTELHLTQIDDRLTINSFTSVHLPNLIILGMKPKRNNGGDYDGYGFNAVSQILAALASTSNNLNSFVNNGGMPSSNLSQIATLPLHITNLEILEETGYGFLHGSRFDFLTGFPSLKTLRITWSRSGYGLDNYFLNLYAHISATDADITDLNKVICNQMSIKNARIWTLLPKLMRIYVKAKCHFRTQ